VDLLVTGAGRASWGTLVFRCALGRGGLTGNKVEGDGATPIGSWPMRRLLYRADRVGIPRTRLPLAAVTPEDGWSDDPGDPLYNVQVRLPHPWHHERLWRSDPLYDLVVVLGYNDAPVAAGAGSAVFLHVARPDFAPTEGCVALAQWDLEAILADAVVGDRVTVPDETR